MCVGYVQKERKKERKTEEKERVFYVFPPGAGGWMYVCKRIEGWMGWMRGWVEGWLGWLDGWGWVGWMGGAGIP